MTKTRKPRKRQGPEGPRHKGWVGRTPAGSYLAPRNAVSIEPWFWVSRGALEAAALHYEDTAGVSGAVRIFRAVSRRECAHPGERSILAGCAASEPSLDEVPNGLATRQRAARERLAAKLSRADAARAKRAAKAAAKAAKVQARAAAKAPPVSPRAGERARSAALGNAPRKAPATPRGEAHAASMRAPSARGLLVGVGLPAGWTAPLGASVQLAGELPAITQGARAKSLLATLDAGGGYMIGATVYEHREGAVTQWRAASGHHWCADTRYVSGIGRNADTLAQGATGAQVQREMDAVPRASGSRVGLAALYPVDHRESVRGASTRDGIDHVAVLSDGASVWLANATTLRALLDATADPVELRAHGSRLRIYSGDQCAAMLAAREPPAAPPKGRRKARR